jgi:hypothetical protein
LREADAEVVGRDILQRVRLVEDDRVVVGQQPAAGAAECEDSMGSTGRGRA